jgi:Uma2 family endonuclease
MLSAMVRPPPIAAQHPALRYRRPVRPLIFRSEEPENEKLGETSRHLQLRTFLFQLLQFALGREHSVGSDQFTYWNARDPQLCCAPDAFVKLGVPQTEFETWKTWLHGAPDLVIEIASKSDREALTWEEKHGRFHEMGVREVVRFDVDASPGSRIRAWDRIDDDLVEREVEGDVTPCATLGLWWVVASVGELANALRLARDREGRDLLLSQLETIERDKAAVEREKAAAERRVAELEAELAKLRG